MVLECTRQFELVFFFMKYNYNPPELFFCIPHLHPDFCSNIFNISDFLLIGWLELFLFLLLFLVHFTAQYGKGLPGGGLL